MIVPTAVVSLTTVARAPTDSAEQVAITDTGTYEAVKFLPAPAGCHGVNWGAKLGPLLGAWNTPDHAADIDGDCIVDGADLGLLLETWTG